MQVVEQFVSINGEGTRAGELAVFIRFKGCNLRCSYCDTMWANEADCEYTDMSLDAIVDYVISTGVRNVTLTGGEPLLQKDISQLITKLLNAKSSTGDSIRVEIETNGAVDLTPYSELAQRPTFTMDYKLPSSGCENKMLLNNISLLLQEDTVKFVCGSVEDLDRAYELITEYDLTKRCNVYFSPVFGSIEPVQIVDYMIDKNINDARLQIQMHKVIWDPNKRGV